MFLVDLPRPEVELGFAKPGAGMRRIILCVGAAFLLATLGACSHAGNVGDIATDYNRAMARARSEQILLNILRAGGRETLQFTAFGEITATVNRSVGIDTVATNLITGGRDAISPTLRLGGSTVPIVRIAPLANQEFTNGLLRPITPDVLGLFVSQGWDAEFLLPLVVSSYQCPSDREQTASNAALRANLAAVNDNFLLQETKEGQTITLTVSTDRALEMLRTGAAPGHTVVGIEPGPSAGQSIVRVKQPDSTRWIVNLDWLCPGAERGELRLGEQGPGTIQLRSPESILYFLGASVRPCLLGLQTECALTYTKNGETHYLFRLRSGPREAATPAIAVSMYGVRFWIPRLDAADTDRTLKTISFLNQLIALQTSASSVNLTPTIITTSAGH